MIDEHLAFLYDESERNLKKACGEGESLPFTREELLDTARHRKLNNTYTLAEITEGDARAAVRRVYLCAFRRVPDEHALDAMDGAGASEEARLRVRDDLIRCLPRSAEAREKKLVIRHNPADRRNAVRRLTKEGGAR